ncbi:MAG: serine/threonine-protein phosphatase [Actinomycetota bacterium]|nr:serine/threonine-protein phosphatase [Actinomycetota bacterium]
MGVHRTFRSRDGLTAAASWMVYTPPGSLACDALHCDAGLFAVADGVDHSAGSGEIALTEILRLAGPRRSARRLHGALQAANWTLWHNSSGVGDSGVGLHGATVTVAMWLGHRVVLFHVGDSRAYLVRAGQPKQLTTDQTRPGPLANDEAAARVGLAPDPVHPEFVDVSVEPGDRLVLCTDGLWECLDPVAMAAVGTRSAAEACKSLESRAMDKATEDATAVVVAFSTSHGRGPQRPGSRLG